MKSIYKFIFLISNIIFAQQNVLNYSLLKSYTKKDGLASNNVYDITQDQSGFIWIATDNGISRFDGTRFYNYKNENSSNDIIQIFRTKNNILWTNTFLNPPMIFNETKNEFYPINHDQSLFSSNLIFRKSGDEFVAKNNKIIFRIFNDSTSTYVINKKNCDELFLINGNNKIRLINFVFLNGLLEIEYCENNKISKTYFKIDSEKKRSFYCDNALFYYDDNYLFRYFPKYINGKIKVEKSYAKLNAKITSFQINNENINLFDEKGYLSIYNSKNLNLVLKVQLNNQSNCAFIDNNKNLWVGTIDDGLQFFKKINVKNINLNFESQWQKININNSFIVVSNSKNEVLKLDRNGIKKDSFNFELSESKQINNLYFNKNGDVLVSLSKGITKYNSNTIHYLIEKDYLYCKTSEKLNDNNYLIGTNKGIFLYDEKNNNAKKIITSKDVITNIKVKDRNQFYFTSSNKVYLYSLESKKIKSTNNINSQLKNGIDKIEYQKERKTLWVSDFNNTIYGFRDNRLIHLTKEILSANKIISDGSYLYILTKEGVYVLDTEKTKNNQKVIKIDNLKSTKINDIITKNDSLYVLSNNQIEVLSKKIIFDSNKKISSPHLIEIKANNKTIPKSDKIKLEKNQTYLKLTFAQINFTSDLVQIEYKLNSNSTWNKLNENILNLELPSGNHTISYRNFNKSNSTYGKITNLMIDIDYYFYETVWFKSIITLFSIFLILSILYVIKTNKQKITEEKNNQLAKQRNKFQMDLHDEIGAGVSAVKLQSELLKNQVIKNKTIDIEEVDYLIKISDEINVSMREMLWSLNTENDKLLNFTEYCKNYTKEYFKKTPIELSFIIEIDNYNVVFISELRRNLFLILKESCHNIIKHSKATKVEISLIKNKESFLLKIHDNGIGFIESSNSGYGLSIMKTRAENMNGVLNIDSSNSKGTLIELTLTI